MKISDYLSIRQSMENKVNKVSIITIVYNSELLIEGTIKSVLNQTYEHLEYIIVDGASTDETMQIIGRYKDKISVVISEPDKGLYDAMNKGLLAATGDYVWFMNSGDHIHTPQTLETIMLKAKNSPDTLYGEVMMVDDDRTKLGTRSETTTQKLPKNLTWKSLKHGMVVCHQAFIVKRSLAEPYVMDNLSADIDWVIKVLKKSKVNFNTEEILADFLIGGVSKTSHRASLMGRYKVLQKHYGVIPNFIHHIYIVLRSLTAPKL